MKLKILLFSILITAISFGQSRNFFSESSPSDLHKDLIDYNSKVKKHKTFQLDKDGLSFFLSSAPNRFEGIETTVKAVFPDAQGNLHTYEIYEASSFSDELKEQFPNIKTYVGKNLNQKATNIRITTTPQGFYGYITSPSGSTYINPLTKDGNYYMVFDKSYTSREDETRGICEVTGHEDVDIDFDKLMSKSIATNLINDEKLRKYRLAVACTHQYSNFHLSEAGIPGSAPINERLEAVQAAMTVTIDRVNQVYERDFSVTLEFVSNNESLIQLSSFQDPYNSSNIGSMLNQNQTQLDNIIGSSNYDIGHVFYTGGGGVAALGSVCNDSQKAQGVTGLPAPVGDSFDIDYVAHEIGHQFGATHTQNNNCQRTIGTAMEPGSGNTIMGYAGICPPNVQNSSDDHFHYISIFQIENTITGFSGNCAEEISITNTAPTITLPETTYTIPFGTAFFLDVEATDAQDDDLTYNWEQLDNQVAPQPPQSNSAFGPKFKSFPSTEESRRYFPRFPTVLSGNLSTTWEVIPDVARTMNFGVIVRDNNPIGGQSASETVEVNVANVGPFEVTSPLPFLGFVKGNDEEITWNVAGTNANGINATEVDILLSLDGGQNFEEIASAVPNDGSYTYSVPEDIDSESAVLLIQGTDHIFYALSSIFSINDPFDFECSSFENNNSVDIPDGVGNNEPGAVASSNIQLFVDETIERVRVGVDIEHTYINDLVITLKGPNGEEVILFDRDCNNENGINALFDDEAASIPSNCSNPLAGIFSPSEGELSVFTGTNTQGQWRLEVQDFWNQDTGTLNSWYIEFCGENLSISEEVTSDFSIHPNPSNGNFTINFSGTMDANAKGKVYDMNGKLIQKISLNNVGTSTNVQLQNASKGVYLIELENNGTRSVEKLIVK